MHQTRAHFFNLHESLIMAALAALGGVSSSVVSMVGKAVHASTGVPGGLQFLAGIHVLWLILAVGLIRKPGAATVAGLLKGAVELLTGNPHGLFVLMYSGLAGVVVDATWLMSGRRHHVLAYGLAGGLGSASNILIFKLILGVYSSRAVDLGLAGLAVVAFISGVLLAGLLGWSLLRALQSAGITTSTIRPAATVAGRRSWKVVGLLWAAFVLVGLAIYAVGLQTDASTKPQKTTTQPAVSPTIPPE
ncbi:MAG: ECF transporter S component [Planctomycetota bacterium]